MALAIALVALLAIVATFIRLNQPACVPQPAFIQPFLVTKPCDD